MLTEEELEQYNQNGYLVVKQFISQDECDKLKSVVHRLIDEWQPDEDFSWMLTQEMVNGKSQDQFLIESADKISIFVEKDAIDPQTAKLNRDKHLSVKRLCCALHTFEPEFHRVTFSEKTKLILHDLKFIEPAVRQSLYILKQPYIGEKVVVHRDSMYAFNDPLNLVGIWIALEDATVENGCLWFLPGSHTKMPQQRLVRISNGNFSSNDKLVLQGDAETYDESQFVPVEVKAGDAIIIHQQVVHKSEQNRSSMSRHAFTFHILEMHNCVYLKENWNQPAKPFPLVFNQ